MLQLLADGLTVGSIVSLGAVGLTMTYGLMRFANFAHGEFLTWGSYLALSALAGIVALAPSAAAPLAPFSFGWGLIVATLAAAALTAALAVALDAALFRRLRARGVAITLVIASFGAALALRNLLQFLYGPIPDLYTREIQIAVAIVPRATLGGMRMTPDQMLTLALATAAMVALHLFLTRATLGKAMRAVSENPALARVAGADVERVLRAAWIVGAGLAALAGVMGGLTAQIRPQLGFDLLLPMFAAAILGGVGNVWGAALGGLIVGLAESFATPLLGAQYRAAASFAVIVALLLLRPQGLLGARP
jgi:branched-chain amino acid transport system permease protein